MNNIPTTIEAREKLFDEKFKVSLALVDYKGLREVFTQRTKPTPTEIKSFLLESYNELLRAMVETAEGMKIDDPWEETKWNVALSTLQDKIKSYIK